MAHPKKSHASRACDVDRRSIGECAGRPGFLTGEARERALKNLSYTHEVLKIYRPNDNGGWNMFPNQTEPSLHNVYTTALALLALLETRKANLPWDGSVEKRDQLLKPRPSGSPKNMTTRPDSLVGAPRVKSEKKPSTV